MRADNTKPRVYTAERRAAQSELMRWVRPVDGKKPEMNDILKLAQRGGT